MDYCVGHYEGSYNPLHLSDKPTMVLLRQCLNLHFFLTTFYFSSVILGLKH